MNYQEVISFLFSQLPMYQRVGKSAYKADLKNTIALDEYFSSPHKKFKTIHIAGTNGKGSVSHMLSSVLQTAGYKVGLYTSPHLLDFRERIKINEIMISENEVVDFVETNINIIKEIKPSFFEMTVAMAFEYFAQKEVDIAVIEVGMGGRLDSTNIILPELSIITNIGYDHMAFLGNTLDKIAQEKAGIIKKDIPVIVGESHSETKNIFSIKAKENNSPIVFADKQYKIEYSLVTTDQLQVFNVQGESGLDFKNLKTDLLGMYQKKNTITALSAINKLVEKGWEISRLDIFNGFSEVIKLTGLQGRWQIIEQNPLIVCDTAHNKEGLTEIVKQINNTAYKKLHIVFGMVDDKSKEPILEILPNEVKYYFVKSSVPRALNENILKDYANNFGLKGDSYSDVRTGIMDAIQNSNDNDMIYIGGSTFVVADALEFFNS